MDSIMRNDFEWLSKKLDGLESVGSVFKIINSGIYNMTTKEQERTALNKIRNILGTLDADSWVNTAFKGVCDIAQENIDNDFACSPVERVEELEKELDKAEKREISWKADAEHYKGEYDALKELQDKLGCKSVKRGILLEKLYTVFENDLENSNGTILECCGNPESADFKNAVAMRENAKHWIDEIKEIL